MKKSLLFILTIITINSVFTNLNDLLSLKQNFYSLLNEYYYNDTINDNPVYEKIISEIKIFLEKNFDNVPLDNDTFNDCSYQLFNKTKGIYNYLYLFSYSGKEFSDLGLQSDCIEDGFAYYLLSFNYNITSKEKNQIYEFLEHKQFYIGLCLFNECDALIKYLFTNNTYFFNDLYNPIIVKLKDKEKENSTDANKPYYSLNNFGEFYEELTEKEKNKYNIFMIVFIIVVVILGIETLMSFLVICGYNLYNNDNNNKKLKKDLNGEKENDNEEDEEEEKEETIEDHHHNIFTNNSSIQKEQNNTIIKNIINIINKYFSIFTNIMILTIKKSKYYNNKNMISVTKLRIISLLLITFSTNFDVFIKMSSRAFYDDYFYKQIYFVFFKFASFGLDMYICLDGFEVMYKLMNYYKKYYYNKGDKTINLIGILKFYFFSLYRIINYIFIFLIVNYFNRYYIYIHKGYEGEAFYSFFSTNIINKDNISKIFNPKYTLLSYFFPRDKNIDDFISNSKISILFINEFYIFTIFIIIFYIGNILKSKKYDYSILIFMLISYIFTYFICLYSNNFDPDEIYSFNKITRNILLIKYPHILFNHYLIGAFTGLICFYMKDLNLNNSISSDKDKCPFNFCLKFLVTFDFLLPKLKKFWMILSFLIQLLICSTFTLLLYLNNKKNNNNLSLNFILSFKILYYYESGLFILFFCLIAILLFSDEIESHTIGKYNILNLINRISFTYINTIYLMTYSYYCLFVFQFKLTYQNLWIYTFGIFVFFCMENLVLTIIFCLPFKIMFKYLIDKYIILNKNLLRLDEMKYKNTNLIGNNVINSYNNDEDDDDSDSR